MTIDPEKAKIFQAKLAALSQEFAVRQTRMIADFRQEWRRFRELSPGEKDWDKGLERLIFIVHSLAGSSGTFGFMDISRLATKIEEKLRMFRDQGSASAGQMKQLDEFVKKLTT